MEKNIYSIRGQNVLLDSDLADLYGVSTKVLNQAVKRNQLRFPSSFMFQLSQSEYINLRSQSVTFKKATQSRKYKPYVFTEHGVAMLSAVLNSKLAVKVSVAIIEEFIRMRASNGPNIDLESRVSELEEESQVAFRVIFQRLDSLESDLPILSKQRKKIGLKD